MTGIEIIFFVLFVLYSYLNFAVVAHNGVQFVMMVSRIPKLELCVANWGIPRPIQKLAVTRTTDMQRAALFSRTLIVMATRVDYYLAFTTVWDDQTALTSKTLALNAVIMSFLVYIWLPSMF